MEISKQIIEDDKAALERINTAFRNNGIGPTSAATQATYEVFTRLGHLLQRLDDLTLAVETLAAKVTVKEEFLRAPTNDSESTRDGAEDAHQAG